MARLNEESILTFSYQKSSDAEDLLILNGLCSQAHAENTFLKIHLIHVGSEEIYCMMFKIFCIFCFIFHRMPLISYFIFSFYGNT